MNNKPIVRFRSLRVTAGKLSRVGNAFLPTTLMNCNRWAKKPAHPTYLPPASMQSNAAHQSGAVLIVSLIMLLLLTLIGVTGSQVTNLEEKMAGNSRDHNLAFQAAESALRVGEAATMGSPVFYTGSTQPINWANAAVTTYSGGTLTGIYQPPVYIIESLPNTTGAGGCPPCEGGTSESSTSISWYRITARGMGGTANALVTLQSIYRR